MGETGFERGVKCGYNQRKRSGEEFYGRKLASCTAIDTLITTYFGFSSWKSKRRKLVVTVDGVHLNQKGAKGLAHLIEEEGV